tara:strand:- start:49 stop:480 length:432 start_codon:yes stop_codon:yes gene_type:complete
METSRSALKLEYSDYKGEGYGEDTGPSDSFIYWAYEELVAFNAEGGDPASWYNEELRRNPQYADELFTAYQMFIDDYYDGDVRNLQKTKKKKKRQPDRNLSRPENQISNGEVGASMWPDDTAAFIAVGVALLGIAILAARELR